MQGQLQDALYVACCAGSKAEARRLIAEGANPNAARHQNSSRTLLEWACYDDHVVAFDTLLSLGEGKQGTT